MRNTHSPARALIATLLSLTALGAVQPVHAQSSGTDRARIGMTDAPVTGALSSANQSAAGLLTELGLDLLRSAPGAGNAVVSPTSVSVALGMLHAGASDADGREIAQLFGDASAGRSMIQMHLPALLDRAASPQDGGSEALTLASRLWVHQASASQLQPAFVQALHKRYRASSALIDFAAPDPARQAINGWVGEQTRGLITDLLGPGSIGADTRMVLVQATHFRSPWVEPFQAANTRHFPFEVARGAPKPIPTMHGLVKARVGRADGLEIFELPFARGDMVAQIALPPAGTSLPAALASLDGRNVTAWSDVLRPARCQVQLPRLTLKPAVQSLKAALQGLGVQQVFSAQASFAQALGATGAGMQLSDLFHAASLTLDEQGGEAAAATAAVVTAKSFDPMPARLCVINRPFLLVLLHKPTRLPLFIARVTDPSQP